MRLMQKTLSLMLAPFSAAYGLVMYLRRIAWESGFFSKTQTICPCISVGNICWGGTGKTPLTGWLLTWSEKNNIKAIVLTRGYGVNLKIAPLYVKSEHSAHEVGDEPLMLGLDHPESVILVDPQRSRAARYAERSLDPDLFILDDGFQHLSIQRNMDLVLLRAEDLFADWNNLIPGGCWREGSWALKRAGVFLIKSEPAAFLALLPKLKQKLEQFEAPVFSFFLKPVRLEKLNSHKVDETGESFKEAPYVLLSAVGNPVHVEKTVTQFIGRTPEKHYIFPDHYSFSVRDCNKFAALGLPIICTRKDAAKLRYLAVPNLWALRVEVVFGPCLWSNLAFPQWIDLWWEKQHQDGLEYMDTSENFWNGFSAGVEPLNKINFAGKDFTGADVDYSEVDYAAQDDLEPHAAEVNAEAELLGDNLQDTLTANSDLDPDSAKINFAADNASVTLLDSASLSQSSLSFADVEQDEPYTLQITVDDSETKVAASASENFTKSQAAKEFAAKLDSSGVNPVQAESVQAESVQAESAESIKLALAEIVNSLNKNSK